MTSKSTPIRLTPARRRTARRTRTVGFPSPIRSRLGLVCAGGGVTGAVYEIGALAAIEDRLDHGSLTDFDVFVGVSCGSYITALLANGVTPGLLYRNVTRSSRSGTALDELALFRLNTGEIASRLAAAPMTIFDAAWHFYRNRRETTLTDLVQSLGGLLPSGLFQNEGLETWMAKWFDHPDRTDDFRKLNRSLRIVAVELDTGETKAFGGPGTDHVPISKAVRASCTMPGLYRPVKIDGVEYIDGGVRKTAHISLALQERCGLIICVNPIVPLRLKSDRLPLKNGEQGTVSGRGLPSILDQVFRVTLHSRMKYGITRYEREAPDSDILVFEPKPEDLPRFMSNIMRTSGRVRIAEYAYQSTMKTIDDDFERISRIFARHGLKLRTAAPEGHESIRAARDLASDVGEMTSSRLAASLRVLERNLADTA
ncbi:MAG: patatin-like phospholipase family protein [Thermoanaerobaculia bacterium]